MFAALSSYVWGDSFWTLHISLGDKKITSTLRLTESLASAKVEVFKPSENVAFDCKVGDVLTLQLEGRPEKKLTVSQGQLAVDFANETETKALVSLIYSNGLRVTSFQRQIKTEETSDTAQPTSEKKEQPTAEKKEFKDEKKEVKENKKEAKEKKEVTEEELDTETELKEAAEALTKQIQNLSSSSGSSQQQQQQLDLLKGRLTMIESMQKNLAADKEKGLDVNDPDYLQKLRQRGMRENMESMLANLSKSNDPKHKAQINALRENISQLDKMLNMTPQERALDLIKTQIHHMETNVVQLTEELKKITSSDAPGKEEKALQMGHGIFVTKHVIGKLKVALETPDAKLKSEEDVEVLRMEATKTALLTRIKQLQGENKPEKYGTSIKMLKSRYEQMLSGNTCGHNHAQGGHGHSHGGQGGQGGQGGHGGHGGHGHSHSHGHNHSHGGHGGHGHSHGEEGDDEDHEEHDEESHHGHSHNGVECHGHGK